MAEKIVREPKKTAPATKAADKTKETVTNATETVKKTTAKQTAPKQAAPKQQTVITPNKPTGGSTVGLRIGACVLWLLAIVCEAFAIMVLMEYYIPPFNMNAMTFLIIMIVLDMALAIIAAQLWKKANHIKPMSEKRGKFLFYLWNELGVIMAIICFLPLIIFLLKDKKLDKKTKIIATVVAIVAMLVAGVASAEFNPISAEEKKSAENLITQDVCWTAGGHKYHIDDNCQSIRNSDYYKGTVKEAIESGKGTLCAFCAREVNEAAAAAMNPDTATPQQLEKLALLKELGYDETGIINIAQHLESLKTEGDVQSAVKAAEPEVNNLVQDETKTEEKR